MRKTHPRWELFPLRRTSRHAWIHSHVWAACIIGATGSKLPESVCFLVRIILICHGRVSAAAGDSRGCILAEVCPGCYTDFRFPLTLRFQAQEQCGHGLLATDRSPRHPKVQRNQLGRGFRGARVGACSLLRPPPSETGESILEELWVAAPEGTLMPAIAAFACRYDTLLAYTTRRLRSLLISFTSARSPTEKLRSSRYHGVVACLA